ncbi:hypothetical protein BU25DRAFT_181340 [Macroventuria anomochaeta]|uniref:Uncharacterized protein n=1 Tax=Macroventuria anomochaeta TaxID=301207 RepID=A0ACB6RN10_9PLEO|nr:uncharacterized protein BU25DRAFT_181340 [Macroventuria anomochaeta]KAF2623266.1 hypothetical protein BU25DRAFT_181340 [Macroventuria anomochaeta]
MLRRGAIHKEMSTLMLCSCQHVVVRRSNQSVVTHLGRWPEARAVKEYVLQAWRGMLGEEHPDTIRAISNLAITFRQQGYLGDTASVQKEVLKKWKQTLGEDHSDVISAMIHLVNMFGEQWQLGDPAVMQKEVLEAQTNLGRGSS